MSSDESLLDTIPGRLFIETLAWFWSTGADESVSEYVRGLSADDLLSHATRAVGSYLYSNDPVAAARLDASSCRRLDLDVAARWALDGWQPFGSPQVHQGSVTEVRAPVVANRSGFGSLPQGAFWTATPLGPRADSWGECGENLSRGAPRCEVHFDVADTTVAIIRTAADWVRLIAPDAVDVDGTLHPNWPAIARRYDAVHLTVSGLLLAHPRLSQTPFASDDGSGYAHSVSGPYVGVGNWSTVSTAWMHRPPGVRLKPR